MQGMASQYAILNGSASAHSPSQSLLDALLTGRPPRPSPAHQVGLLAISQHPTYCKRLSVPLIIAGTTLFSGSIFALLLYKDRCVSRSGRASVFVGLSPAVTDDTSVRTRSMGSFARVVGPTTPIGGLLMIGGYLSLVRPPRRMLSLESRASPVRS